MYIEHTTGFLSQNLCSLCELIMCVRSFFFSLLTVHMNLYTLLLCLNTGSLLKLNVDLITPIQCASITYDFANVYNHSYENRKYQALQISYLIMYVFYSFLECFQVCLQGNSNIIINTLIQLIVKYENIYYLDICKSLHIT